MGTGLKVVLVGVATAVMFGLVVMGLWISANNKEKSLRNQAAAQQKICQVVFDETWKIINQKCQVKDSYKDSFKEIFTGIMEGRYSNARGGSLMSWIQEANPNFDSSIFKDIMVSIEAQRHKFTGAQSTLVDIKREHDNLRTMFPSSIFVGGKPALEIIVVTSTNTEEIFKMGVEDNIVITGKQN